MVKANRVKLELRQGIHHRQVVTLCLKCLTFKPCVLWGSGFAQIISMSVFPPSLNSTQTCQHLQSWDQIVKLNNLAHCFRISHTRKGVEPASYHHTVTVFKHVLCAITIYFTWTKNKIPEQIMIFINIQYKRIGGYDQ